MKRKYKAFALLLTCLLAGSVFLGCTPPEADPPVEVPPIVVPPFDATELPYYVEDTESLQYSYTADERIQPFWLGNVIYNEQLMVVDREGVVEGHLMYTPKRVLSVRDWSLKTEYVEGVDYTFNGATLSLPAGSSIAVFHDEWARGINVPAQWPATGAGSGYQMIGDWIYTETNLIWGHYIHVTYVYDPADVDRTTVKKYNPNELVGFSEMIAAKKDINMLVFGDSISEGHSSSELWGHDPLCPPYFKLVKYGIETYGGVKVNMTNLSLGGKDSTWAADEVQLEAVRNAKPDLLILAFGMNDVMSAVGDSPDSKFGRNIRRIIESARMANENCQIVLVAPFAARAEMKLPSIHVQICETLKYISEKVGYLDVGYVSMYEHCVDILKTKAYYEIGGNNQNHPNDFIQRFYAMNILTTLFDHGAL
jgi:hypothetical protein